MFSDQVLCFDTLNALDDFDMCMFMLVVLLEANLNVILNLAGIKVCLLANDNIYSVLWASQLAHQGETTFALFGAVIAHRH